MVKNKTKKLTVELSAEDREKAKARAARFGLNADDAKAKQRAAKFGLFHPDLEKDKLKQRSDRFKHNLPALTEEEKEKRRRRADRFAVPAADQTKPAEEVDAAVNKEEVASS